MPQITIVTREGEENSIEATEGLTLMEAIRDSGFDEMLSLCGGCRSCATCQVHIDPAFKDKLPEMSEEESELLDSSEYRDENSRLSCQIPITAALAGCKVTIAPED